jgi:hypothetical protein
MLSPAAKLWCRVLVPSKKSFYRVTRAAAIFQGSAQREEIADII